jgi:hypothetical protein
LILVEVRELRPLRITKTAGCLPNFRGCWELSLGMKWPGCEAGHVPADIKKAFVTWWLIKQQYNFICRVR